MIWTRVYRFALLALPRGLREKHGSTMEVLYGQEVRRARARGILRGVVAGGLGVWDWSAAGSTSGGGAEEVGRLPGSAALRDANPGASGRWIR